MRRARHLIGGRVGGMMAAAFGLALLAQSFLGACADAAMAAATANAFAPCCSDTTAPDQGARHSLDYAAHHCWEAVSLSAAWAKQPALPPADVNYLGVAVAPASSFPLLREAPFRPGPAGHVRGARAPPLVA